MAKITLELTDTIIRVSGPSSFLPLNKAVGSSDKQFKIVLDTATATANLSKIGTAADNTTLVFFGKSTDYQVNYNARTGIANVVDSAMKIVASLPIPKLAANNVKLNFADYEDATTLNYQVTDSAVGTSVSAAAAADFSAIIGSVKIATGATTGTFTVTPSSDGVVEGYEGFNVVLLDSSYTKVATSGNVVIADAATVTVTGQTFTLTTGLNTLAFC